MNDYITLDQASTRVIGGKRRHRHTYWRWCMRGVDGVYLEHTLFGATICVRECDIVAFAERLAAKKKTSVTVQRHRTVRPAEDRVRDCQARLARLGI